MSTRADDGLSLLERLPADERRLILKGLPARSLIACEAASHALRAAVAGCDDLWTQFCPWPRSNLGALTPTHRSCFSSGNGWMHLASLPRETFQAAATTTLCSLATMTAARAPACPTPTNSCPSPPAAQSPLSGTLQKGSPR